MQSLLERGWMFLVAVVVALAVAPCRAEGQNPCCPADLDGDTSVGPADLGILLGDWGATGTAIAADLDNSGTVDAPDLAVLLGAWGACPSPCSLTTVAGMVEFEDGSPALQAIVVTDQGGLGVPDADGWFSFPIDVPDGVTSLHVTAVAQVGGATYIGEVEASPIVLGGVTWAGVITLVDQTGCEPAWLPAFGARPGANEPVYALQIFDDGKGGGPALYAGGQFSLAGGAPANRIARWDGWSWSPLGSGVDNTIYALAVFDDGSGAGPALYAGGSFNTAGGVAAKRIARWDGSSWSPLGSGILTGAVYTLTTFDDGSGGGPALYAGGSFNTAGGVVVKSIARWDGSSWSSLGSGVGGGWIEALVTFDDGSGAGTALYASGSFATVGDVPANNIARWNGSSWSPLGNGTNGTIFALSAIDSGMPGGPALYAGGEFTGASGVAAMHMAKWNGSVWKPLGSGTSGTVRVLQVHDSGSGAGPALYAGGSFGTAGGVSANGIARWNGSSWSALGSGLGGGLVGAMTSAPARPGAAPALLVGGSFTTAGGTPVAGLASWSNSSWSPIGQGLNDRVFALETFDDGAGPALYAGGSFGSVNGEALTRIGRWNGTTWSPLGTGMGGGAYSDVYALATFDDRSGTGPALYAGGAFTTAGGATVNYLAKWDGVSWSPVGGGMNGVVRALETFDDGSGAGPMLYAAGSFTMAGGVPAKYIARWDGSSWSELGSGTSGIVFALASFDDGSGGGPRLYAGGFFTAAGGVAAANIARWNGSSWSPLGSGVDSTVLAFTVFDDGSGAGPALYVGGAFTTAGGVAAQRIARWDGSSWSALGSGASGLVSALTTFDDGSGPGPSLIVGGEFTTAGEVAANRIARWDGLAWHPLGGGVNGGTYPYVYALATFDDGSGGGAALFAGGEFGTSPAGDSYLAKWGVTCRRPANASER